MGFNFIEKSKRVNVWEAERILTTKKQRYYTTAVRRNMDVDLIGNYLVCPHCGKEFVANTRYSNCGYHWYFNNEGVSKNKIYDWSTTQLSFFDDENCQKVLPLSSPINRPPSFKCPECKNVSNYSEGVKNVELLHKNKKITIKSEITNIGEVFGFKWIGEDSISITFPMYEVLTFNFRKGRIHIKLESDKGNVLSERDVTPYPELLYGSIVHNLIMYNKKVNRNIKRMFKEEWGSELPYRGKIIGTKNLFEMTLFVGYTKEFYSAVPYKLDSMAVDDSFKKNARKIRDAKNIVTLFDESRLPKVKSIRRVFYKNPALFFYLDEAEMVWEVIRDLNVFCDFVGSYNIYEVLSDIHMRPGIIEYIADLCEVKTARSFIKNMQYGWRDMLLAAIDYSCANSSVKKAVQENWKGRCSIGRIVQRKPLYSVPMKRPEERIVDCNIDGYDFFWLRSSNEYEIAGKKLKNCLASWGVDNSPVVCVKKGEQYVAAIEILNGMIVQARAYNNTSIECDRNLSLAFEKWQKKYHVEWEPISYDDDEDDDDFLPGLD